MHEEVDHERSFLICEKERENENLNVYCSMASAQEALHLAGFRVGCAQCPSPKASLVRWAFPLVLGRTPCAWIGRAEEQMA